jgi:hypothetical protein
MRIQNKYICKFCKERFRLKASLWQHIQRCYLRNEKIAYSLLLEGQNRIKIKAGEYNDAI